MGTLPKKATPCYECEDRHSGCHSNCERYAKYRAELNALNDARKQALIDEENFYASQRAIRKKANRKNHRSNRKSYPFRGVK